LESEKKNVEAVLAEQFRCSLEVLEDGQSARIVIAYEPVWAIGAGDTATPEDAANAHRFIRALANGRFGAEAAAIVRILYGGSVKSENAGRLRAQPEIDGFLVGGASLDPVSFASIVNA
jgi:triosephosphate isomerase (TIM)